MSQLETRDGPLGWRVVALAGRDDETRGGMNLPLGSRERPCAAGSTGLAGFSLSVRGESESESEPRSTAGLSTTIAAQVLRKREAELARA
jgi:hypothetical protein